RVPGDPEVSELTPTAVTAPRIAATLAAGETKGPRVRAKTRETWWRYVVAAIAIAVSLFPVVYVVSSAFSAQNDLGTSRPWPQHVTVKHFTDLLTNNVVANTGAKQDIPFPRWFMNSIIVAGMTALFTTLLGALAAYAFSRFRFKGRRLGMLFLLLIQMFPQFVAVAAIYLIVLNIGGVFPQIGLNKLAAIVIVYLGGAMGVQAWLMKGFFDTIPKELDESARVDGATAAQIFWGVVLPLALPV